MAYAVNQRFFHPIYQVNAMIVSAGAEPATWNVKIGINTNFGTGLFAEAQMDTLFADGWRRHSILIEWPDP